VTLLHEEEGSRPPLPPSPHPDRDPRTTGTSRCHRPETPRPLRTRTHARNRPGAGAARPCPGSHANHHDLALTARRCPLETAVAGVDRAAAPFAWKERSEARHHAS